MHLFEVTGRSLTTEEAKVLRAIGAANQFGGLEDGLMSVNEKRITNKLVSMGYVVAFQTDITTYQASEDWKKAIK